MGKRRGTPTPHHAPKRCKAPCADQDPQSPHSDTSKSIQAEAMIEASSECGQNDDTKALEHRSVGLCYETLPAEIRQLIAYFVCQPRVEIRVDGRRGLEAFVTGISGKRSLSGQALRTSKLFRDEMLPHLYERTIFAMLFWQTERIIERLTTKARDSLTHVDLGMLDEWQSKKSLDANLSKAFKALQSCPRLKWLRVLILDHHYRLDAPVKMRHPVCVMRGIEHLDLRRITFSGNGHWLSDDLPYIPGTLPNCSDEEADEFEEGIKRLVRQPKPPGVGTLPDR